MAATDIIKGVITLLKSRTTITDLVGAGDDARIYRDMLKQKCSFPALLITEIDGESASSLTGAVGSCTTRVQIDACANLPIESVNLREQVRLILQSYCGNAGDERIDCCLHAGVNSRVVTAVDGSDRHLYVRTIDFLVTHSELIPIR